MYCTIEFAGNQNIVWKMLIAQTDRCFELIEDRLPNGVGMRSHERLYTLDGSEEVNDVLLANDYLDDTISITARMPQSERGLNTFVATQPHVSGCADLMLKLIRMSLAESEIDKEFCNSFSGEDE